MIKEITGVIVTLIMFTAILTVIGSLLWFVWNPELTAAKLLVTSIITAILAAFSLSCGVLD